MSGNSFGKLFKVTTFGESHGKAIGCIVDGCPPNLEIAEIDIQCELDKRKPGLNRFVSQRKENDKVEILSGVFNGKTTGTPVTLLINNIDAKTKDYENIKNIFRPGHGDFAYQKKYGIRDYRGGGRASARETAARVAAGAIAKKYIKQNYNVEAIAFISQIGEIKIKDYCLDSRLENEFNFADKSQDNINSVRDYINHIREKKDSIGSKVSLIITNVPVGLGEPVFDKIDATLAQAFMGINAVKGVEIGSGFDCITSLGSEFRDEITKSGFLSNNAGGVLAGITTGQDITANIAFKPASSIAKVGRSIDLSGNEVEVITKGRHDPCVGIRAPVIVEAMAALVIADHIMLDRAQIER